MSTEGDLTGEEFARRWQSLTPSQLLSFATDLRRHARSLARSGSDHDPFLLMKIASLSERRARSEKRSIPAASVLLK